jgi:hypothetical protein
LALFLSAVCSFSISPLFLICKHAGLTDPHGLKGAGVVGDVRTSLERPCRVLRRHRPGTHAHNPARRRPVSLASVSLLPDFA